MPAWLRTLGTRLLNSIRGSSPDRSFDDEIARHVDLLTQRYVRQGMTPEGARSRRPAPVRKSNCLSGGA